MNTLAPKIQWTVGSYDQALGRAKRVPDLTVFVNATQRIREIVALPKLDVRTTIGLIEFELSGRRFSAIPRLTPADVRLARAAAVAFMMAGPCTGSMDMLKTAQSLLTA